LNKQERRLKRDSELLEKIKGRSGELFASKSDTVSNEDTFKIGVGLEKDYEEVRKLLDEYVALDSARRINHDSVIDLEQRALRHQILITRQLDIERELRKGAFKRTEKMFRGDHYNFKVVFDPKSEEEISLTGSIVHLIINTEKTIFVPKYIFKEPTGWQAFKKLWPYIVIPIVILIGAIIKFIAG
jgi:hypothetical protein